ncbi:MAG: hypothetical protein EXR30_01565 [Betaproteobacteria bacterium]|nr:hypothetical protein [Betaproteobacteria bacterium]MSQ88374.1 hypothetical protein [Betaproteobacteria bacterium]
MSRLAKVFLILLLAAIPLRGMAGVIGDFCQPQHHGAGQMANAECGGCEHNATHGEESDDGLSAKCSHCAACSIGALLVPESARGEFGAAAVALLVPFLDRTLPGRLPEQLDRPPLAL